MAENEENHEGANPGANAGGASQPEVISLADHNSALEALRTDLAGQLTGLQSQLEAARGEHQTALEAAGAGTTAAIEAYAELARQQPGLVPALVVGNSVKEINASIEAAKAAYQQAVSSQGGVGAGGGSRSGGGSDSGERPKDYQIGGPQAGADLIMQGIESGRSGGRLAR